MSLSNHQRRQYHRRHESSQKLPEQLYQKIYKLEKVFILLLTEIHEKLRILVRVLLWEDLSDQLGRILYEDFDQLVPAGFVSEHPLRE